MNWKFWTWPGQIRHLQGALRVANQDNAHLRAALDQRNRQFSEATKLLDLHHEADRHRRGLHRAQL